MDAISRTRSDMVENAPERANLIGCSGLREEREFFVMRKEREFFPTISGMHAIDELRAMADDPLSE
jgi:hypothetical protein